MGVGYVVGCLISILLWNFDRQIMYKTINAKLGRVIKNPLIIQLLYIFMIIIICYGVERINNKYLCNFITAFLVLDISNSERKNLNIDNRMHFYDTISIISKSLVSGFVAPLMYILIFGNYAAIAYSMIFNLGEEEGYSLLRVLRNILTIIPSIFVQLILYIIYICRSRSFKVDFGGDYIKNTIIFPILNTDILAAYIESVNFYMYRNYEGMHYLKSYGKYSNKIDKVCIKDYLSISYSICLVLFTIFFALIMQ